MLEAALVAEQFSYSYPDAGEPALRELSVELQPGSFTVIAGASASGKSTLVRAACGLVPHFHGGSASGELSVCGLNARENGPAELSAVCGAVLQDPESQVVMSGVRAEIALPLENRGEPPAAVARAVEETALTLGIGHLLDRRVDTLSGGELQRVALAAALAPAPSLLVLDEPTSQLDPVAGDELLWLLRRLNEEQGLTVLLAEHRLERCLGAADRVLALDEGRLVCDAPPRYFLQWALEAAPELATPAARLFALAGLTPPPVTVGAARRALAAGGLAAQAVPPQGEDARTGPSLLDRFRTRGKPAPALELRGLWYELEDGPALLRGIDLSLAPGERVALLGRNGAGKSTLLRLSRGLIEPTRGSVESSGRVALLLQNPGDYLVHEHAREEVGSEGLRRAGLADRAERNPRDLSGGERQRLALEIAMEGEPPALACLDEPTRGMDRAWKRALSERIDELAADGIAVLVATHDVEFAAEWAERVVLMGPGIVVADGAAAAVLSGGRHFTTDVARVLGGAGAALTPEQGAIELKRELVA